MRILHVVMLCVVLLTGCTLAKPQSAGISGNDPKTQSAVDGILAAFDRYPVVAIGEQHGIQQLGDLYQQLVNHPDFAKKVPVLVMEYGNALYQDQIDRYMRGENIPYEELQKVWSDPVGRVPGGTQVIYGQLYAAVRAVNQRLPDGQKIRVLLGDPPIDWSKVKSKADVFPVQAQREQHFAQVVIDEVLNKNLKALVIIGEPHLDRSAQPAPLPPQPAATSQPAAPNASPMLLPMVGTRLMQQIVEERHPGKTFVIVLHTGFVDDACNAEVEGRMALWTAPTLALVADSWLAEIPCQKFPASRLIQTGGANSAAPGGSSDQMIGGPPAGAAPGGNQDQVIGGPPAGATQPMPNKATLIAGADAYLYVGPRDALTMSPFDPMIYLSSEYFAEQSRRHELRFGEPLDWSTMVRGQPRSYAELFGRSN